MPKQTIHEEGLANVPATIHVEVRAYRVPVRGDIYVAKNGKLKRCRGKSYSRHAQSRLIVYSNYTLDPRTLL